MSRYERIFLTGFMGSGKSTVTPRLARCLGYESVDLDNLISRYLGMSIPAVFDVLGASTFRKRETDMLFGTSSRSNVVISLGGGSVVSDSNLRFCLENGFLVYLKASDSFLADRLSVSLKNRPMLFGEDGAMLEGEALRMRVASLVSERASNYERAHLTVDVDDLSLDSITKQICAEIKTQIKIDGPR